MRGLPLDKKLNFVSYTAVSCCDAALTSGEMVKKDKIEINVFFLGQSGEGQAVQPAKMGWVCLTGLGSIIGQGM